MAHLPSKAAPMPQSIAGSHDVSVRSVTSAGRAASVSVMSSHTELEPELLVGGPIHVHIHVHIHWAYGICLLLLRSLQPVSRMRQRRLRLGTRGTVQWAMCSILPERGGQPQPMQALRGTV